MERYEVQKLVDALAESVENLNLEEDTENSVVTQIGEIERAIDALDATWEDLYNEREAKVKQLTKLLTERLSPQELLDLKFESILDIETVR